MSAVELLEDKETLEALYGSSLVSCDLPHSVIVHVIPQPLEDLVLQNGFTLDNVEGVHVEVFLPEVTEEQPHMGFTRDKIHLHAAWLSTDIEDVVVTAALTTLQQDVLSILELVQAIRQELPMPPEGHWPIALQRAVSGIIEGEGGGGNAHGLPSKQPASVASEPRAEKSKEAASQPRFDFDACPFTLTVGEPIVDRKSTFQGFAAQVETVEAVQIVLDFLKSNPRIAKATHNIVAFRLISNGRSNHDNDSDGEDAAGGQLQHLLQHADAQNVVVMVSRWYGGILLGPDRFKHIKNAARNVLEKGGFLQAKRKRASKK